MIDISEESLLAAAVDSLNSQDFPDSLQHWLYKCLGHDNITVLAYFQNRAPVPKMIRNREPKVHEHISNVYLTGAYLLDPFHELHINKAPAGIYRLSDISPDKFHRNQYFLEYYRNTTMIDEFAFVSYPSPNVSLHVCLGRDSNSNRRFTTRDLAKAHLIAPLVSALTSRHWHYQMSEDDHYEGDVTAKLIEAVKNSHQVSLSPRQAEVALLVLQGHSSVSIGLELGVSFQTVKVFRKQLYKKCQISSQAELFNLMLPILGTISSD